VADSFPQWTPYNYVEGNPASYTDPFGMNPCVTPLSCIIVVIGRSIAATGMLYQAFSSSTNQNSENGTEVYHRRTAAYPDEIDKVLATSEVWGGPRRNIFGIGLAPAVKAHVGPLPEGVVGYEFTTDVPRDRWSDPIRLALR